MDPITFSNQRQIDFEVSNDKLENNVLTDRFVCRNKKII